MIKHFQLVSLLSLSVALYAPAGFTQDAQDDGSAAAPETESEETAPASQEVEINEDNYRQFMELKDARRQGTILPETAYKSQAGAQKIEKLPEDSQKHLRNQLREIIINGDQWQPGDEEGEYPYVPSKAAGTDPDLRKLEAEAWGELVDGYHQREAEIHANSSRSKAAAASAGASSNTPAGVSTGTSGADTSTGKESPAGQKGQDGADQQANRQSRSGASSSAGSYSPNAANDPNARSTQGVSQNALEFLQQNGNQSTSSSRGTANESQTADTSTSTINEPQTNSTSASAINDPGTDSTTGASQNALEYLMGEDEQEGTLTIEDLVNAQGIGGASGAALLIGNTNDDESPDENSPDNDGPG